MKPNWPTKKLGEVTEIYSGGTPRRSNLQYWGNDVPWLTMEDVNKGLEVVGTAQYISNNGLQNSNAQLIPAGSVNLSCTASVGNVTISRISLATNQQFNSFHPKKGTNLISEYLAYRLIFDKAKIKALGGSTTFQFISKNAISNFEIPIPPESVQKQIVERMDKIAEARKLNDELIQKSDELFQSLLHQELNSAGKDWKLKKLVEILKPQYGYTAVAKEVGNYRFIRITDIDEDGGLRSSDKKYVMLSKNKAENYQLRNGDLLLARTGATFGKILYFKENEPSIFASFLIRLNPDTSIDPFYIWLFSRSQSYWRQAKSLMTGSGQPQFNANKLKQIKIPLPPLQTQKQIVAKLSAVQEYKKQLLEQKLKLKELFDSVLHESMNGGLEIERK